MGLYFIRSATVVFTAVHLFYPCAADEPSHPPSHSPSHSPSSLPVSPVTQAKFELVTSEASYIRSLTIAVDHFMLSQELAECLGAQDKQWLFSKLPEVKGVSER